jgi:hypothetical protein
VVLHVCSQVGRARMYRTCTVRNSKDVGQRYAFASLLPDLRILPTAAIRRNTLMLLRLRGLAIVVVARMQAEGRNPGFGGGTWIALRKLRSIQATLATLAGLGPTWRVGWHRAPSQQK